MSVGRQAGLWREMEMGLEPGSVTYEPWDIGEVISPPGPQFFHP